MTVSLAAGPRTLLLTVAAMIAFAANSILCRMALAAGKIDPGSFTAVRLGAGAAALWLFTLPLRRGQRVSSANWGSALALFVYALAFSFAYVRVSAGAGALVLFGAVQLTMVGWGLSRGERLVARQLVGLLLAFLGLMVIAWPGGAQVRLSGVFLMALAGIAWGVYSVRGRGAADPYVTTAGNFVRTLPLVAALALPVSGSLHLTGEGVALAVASGALASGGGYVLWYAALKNLAATRAAVVQLVVPVLAAIGGVVFLAEPLTLRLVVGASATLGGIALANKRARPPQERL